MLEMSTCSVCTDRNECMLNQNICGTAQCKNTPGKYECECPEGYAYNSTTKKCEGSYVIIIIII